MTVQPSRRVDFEGECARLIFERFENITLISTGGEEYVPSDPPHRGDDEVLWFRRRSDGQLFEINVWASVTEWKGPT